MIQMLSLFSVNSDIKQSSVQNQNRKRTLLCCVSVLAKSANVSSMCVSSGADLRTEDCLIRVLVFTRGLCHLLAWAEGGRPPGGGGGGLPERDPRGAERHAGACGRTSAAGQRSVVCVCACVCVRVHVPKQKSFIHPH